MSLMSLLRSADSYDKVTDLWHENKFTHRSLRDISSGSQPHILILVQVCLHIAAMLQYENVYPHVPVHVTTCLHAHKMITQQSGYLLSMSITQAITTSPTSLTLSMWM